MKLDPHPELQHFPIDIRKLCDNPGRVCDYIASSGKVVDVSLYTLVDFSIWPFGCFTLIGDTGSIAMSCD